MPRCANCGEENAARARFCAACGARLDGEAARETVRKRATVVYCDLADSTVLAERLDPEVLRGIVMRYFDEARTTLERHGGSVEKMIGDAVVAVFGLPTTHEDDALRAVRAAVELQRAIDELNGELARTAGVALSVRVGIDTGEVLAGDTARGETFASGDPVAAAEELERAAGAGDVLVGEQTARLVRHAATLEPSGDGAWRVLAVESYAPAVDRRLDVPLVGRDAALAQLTAVFDGVVAERRCRVVTLVGEAGVGKSRLAAELRARLAGRALAVEGRCPPYGEGVTYWPLAEILRTLAGLRPDDRADAARARLAGLLPDEDWSGLAAERLAAAVGAGEGQQARSDEIAWAFRRVLEAVATEQPLLVVLDDVHWAEPTLLDLVDYLAGWSRSAPILVLCLTRGDLLERRPGWGSGEGWATVVLGPLPRADIVRLVELLGGGERADEIADVAAGNALFATELVRMLLDERRRPSARRTTYAGRVPATIQAVLSARLDLLADDERAVLQRAAVVGEVFWWGAVSALAPPELAPRTGSLLAALVRSDLVRPDPAALAGEDGLRFGHVLVREAAYSSIPKRGRADLHERLAVWLEERQGGAPGEQDALAGHHLEQAARYWRELGDAAQAAALAGRASERLVAAGRRAFRLGDMPAALDRLARAAALRPDGDPERARLLVDAAIAAKNAGDFATSTALLDGVVATATDAAVQYAARIERAHCRLMTGEGGPEELLAAAEGAVAASGETGDQAGLAHGWNYVGFELFVRGRFGAMVEMLERGCAHARRVGDTREEQRSLTGIATGLLLGPAPVREAAARCRRIADRSRAIAPWGAAVPAAALAGLEAMRGRVERGWASYEEARNALADTGPPLQSANLPLAAAPLLAHDPERFERELHEAYDLLERLGERGALSTVAAYLAGAVLSQGRGVEAESLTRVSERAAAPEDVLSQIVWRTVRARALSRRGEPDLARELASAGVELARRTDSPLLVAGALLALAEAERELGAADAGAGHAGEALELALRKGDEVTAAHARELLPLDPRVETR